MQETILQSIGKTPLVRLRRVTEGLKAGVYAKMESLNPGGSVKDRVALAMVYEAERRGWLRPGGTIIEATAGNTGVGLAMVAAVKGYRCIFVLPDKMSADKVRLLRAYGAEVVITPTAVASDSPDSYNGVADRLAREIPGAWRPNQFSNLSNPEVHYRHTGYEIWEQTEGKITAFVAGVGTGGTISGVGRYLKEQNPDVRIIGADPEGSVLSGDTPRPWKVEGIGEDFVPKTLNGQLVDEWIRVSDGESFDYTRRMAREEGLLVGGSSGLAVASGIKAARELGPDDVMVILLPDGGRGYLGKVFSDKWMRSYGFLPASEDRTVADIVGSKDGSIPEFVHAHPNDTVREVMNIMKEFDVSQVPVLSAEPPVVMGEVMGSIDERGLLDDVFTGKAQLTDRVAGLVGKPFALIGMHQSVEEAREALAGADALLVTSDGKPVAMLTRHDLLAFLSA